MTKKIVLSTLSVMFTLFLSTVFADEPAMHRSDMLKWGSGLAGLLIAVILILFFLNQKLQRKVAELTHVKKELQKSENRHRSLQESSFEGIVITDKGIIIEANAVLSRRLGYPLSELIGMETVKIFADKEQDNVKAKMQAGYQDIYESVCLTKSGTLFPVEVHAKEFRYEDRQVRCAAIRDISDRYKALGALLESENKFRALALSAHDAIAMTDADGKIVFWNKSAERIFQYSEDEMLGKDPHTIIVPSVFAQKYEEQFPHFQKTGEGGGINRTIERTALKKGGEEFPIELSLSGVQIEGKWCGIGVIRDITERKRMESELRRLATTDTLTGIDNRRTFMEKAEHELRRAQRYGNPFGMITTDIDFFKSINDTYGHQTGDLVLQKMAQAIRSALRESDLFGRIGGEEFAIVLIETEPNTAVEIAERIRSCVEQLSINTEKETIHITISIGVAFFKEGDDFSTLSKRSDEALYAAKNSGRNCVVSL